MSVIDFNSFFFQFVPLSVLFFLNQPQYDPCDLSTKSPYLFLSNSENSVEIPFKNHLTVGYQRSEYIVDGRPSIIAANNPRC